jgi:hypothetical protein
MIELAATIFCAPFILAAVCIVLWIVGFILSLPYLIIKGALTPSRKERVYWNRHGESHRSMIDSEDGL